MKFDLASDYCSGLTTEPKTICDEEFRSFAAYEEVPGYPVASWLLEKVTRKETCQVVPNLSTDLDSRFAQEHAKLGLEYWASEEKFLRNYRGLVSSRSCGAAQVRLNCSVRFR